MPALQPAIFLAFQDQDHIMPQTNYEHYLIEGWQRMSGKMGIKPLMSRHLRGVGDDAPHACKICRLREDALPLGLPVRLPLPPRLCRFRSKLEKSILASSTTSSLPLPSPLTSPLPSPSFLSWSFSLSLSVGMLAEALLAHQRVIGSCSQQGGTTASAAAATSL